MSAPLEPIQIAESPLAKLLQQCPRLHLGKNAQSWDEVADWLVAHGVVVVVTVEP